MGEKCADAPCAARAVIHNVGYNQIVNCMQRFLDILVHLTVLFGKEPFMLQPLS